MTVQTIQWIAVLIVLGLAGGIILSILSFRQKKQMRHEQLVSMGFMPVKPLTEDITRRIIAIHQHTTRQQLEMENVYRKHLMGGAIYLFDLVDTGGSESSIIGTRMVGVISTMLHLPCFALVPIPITPRVDPVPLMIGAEKILQWAIEKRGLSQIHFPDNPLFDDHFITITQQEQEVRQFLTPARMAFLCAQERPYRLDANDDTFTLTSKPYQNRRKQELDDLNFEQEINLLLADAKTYLTRFQ